MKVYLSKHSLRIFYWNPIIEINQGFSTSTRKSLDKYTDFDRNYYTISGNIALPCAINCP